MFILDTNVVAELRKAKTGKADPNVLAWASSVSAGSLFLSAITVLELETGVLQKERSDLVQGGLLRAWLDGHVLPAFQGRVLPVDSAVALRCAKLHISDPRAERDALIAATALVHGMTVVTRNMSDFVATGVALLNPWTSSEAVSH
jgi:predicted nucleic acid-binding protein